MKKVFIILLMVCSMICTTIGLSACGPTETTKETVETIVAFDDYDDVLLTLCE